MTRRPKAAPAPFIPGALLAAAFLTGAAAMAMTMAMAGPAPADPAARLIDLRHSERGEKPLSPVRAAAELGEIGESFLERGDLGQAIEILEESLSLDPDGDRALASLVLAYVRRGDLEFGRSYLEIAAHRPASPRVPAETWMEIGRRYSDEHQLAPALLAWDLYRSRGGSDAATLAELDRSRREVSASPGQRSLATDDFTVYADEAIPGDALAKIVRGLSDEYARQAAAFGARLDSPQVVVLHAGRRYFSLVSVPDWVSGVFDGKIRVSIDTGRGFGPETGAVLSHEMAHAFIRELSAGHAPGWLHEGLAQWCSGRRIPRSEFRKEFAGQRVRSLAEMEGNLALPVDPATVRGNYVQALGLVEFLAGSRGEAAVFCVVRALGSGDDVAKALARETGWTPVQLVSGWKAWAGL